MVMQEGCNEWETSHAPRPFLEHLRTPSLKQLGVPELWFEENTIEAVRSLVACSECNLEVLVMYTVGGWEQKGLGELYHQSLPGVQAVMPDMQFG